MDAPFALDDISQVKAAFHPLRVRIIEILAEAPATASAVGRRLGITASKAHYHVGVLVRHGLVKLVESRTTGGVTEHFYQAVSHRFELRKLQPSNDTAVVIEQELKAFADDVQAAWRPQPGAEPSVYLAIMRLSGTADSRQVVAEKVADLMQQVDRALAQPPGRAYRLVLGWAPMPDTPPEEEHEC